LSFVGSKSLQPIRNLRDQPGRIQAEGQRLVDKMPGKVQDSYTNANNLQSAGTARFKQLKDEGSTLWRQTLEKEKLNFPQEIDPGQMMNVLKSIKDKQKNYTASSNESKLLGQLHDNLFNDGNLIRSPEQFYQTIRSFKGQLTPQNLASVNVGKDAAKFVNGYANSLKDGIPALQPYNLADKELGKFKGVLVDPLKKSIVGQITGKKGALPDQQANVATMNHLFSSGTQKGETSRIIKLSDELRLAGRQQEFMDATKSHFANKLDEAFRSTDNRINENTAFNLKKAFGSESQPDNFSRGTRDMLIAQADNLSLPHNDKKAYVEGFQKFMTTVSRASNRPGTLTGTNEHEILNTASESSFKRIGQFSIITPFRTPILWYADKLKSDSLGQMDKLLNSPEGVRMLVSLGKAQGMSHKAQTAITTYLATQAQVQNSSANNQSIQSTLGEGK